MPRRAGRPCSWPGCPRLVYDRNHRYCPEHRRAKQREYDARRGTAAERGYDAAWREVRDRFLADHPVCERCGRRRATVVHHIIRKRDGGSDDPGNLMALCDSCHSQLHAERGELFGRDR